MSSRKKIVEKALGVKVPAQYAAFLDKYGIYQAPAVEVYGISDSLLGYDGIPCVIGATINYRKLYGLPLNFLVIHHTGLEDEMICLDTETGKVYSISRELGNHKIADSFNEWFTRDILNPSKEIKERREWIGAYWRQRAEEILEREKLRQQRGAGSSTQRPRGRTRK